MFEATVDLPTPPFPLPTATMFRTFFSAEVLGAGGRHFGGHVHARVGHAGDRENGLARLVAEAVLDGACRGRQIDVEGHRSPSICMLRMKPSDTMSRCRSGSMTDRRASNTGFRDPGLRHRRSSEGGGRRGRPDIVPDGNRLTNAVSGRSLLEVDAMARQTMPLVPAGDPPTPKPTAPAGRTPRRGRRRRAHDPRHDVRGLRRERGTRSAPSRASPPRR